MERSLETEFKVIAPSLSLGVVNGSGSKKSRSLLHGWVVSEQLSTGRPWARPRPPSAQATSREVGGGIESRRPPARASPSPRLRAGPVSSARTQPPAARRLQNPRQGSARWDLGLSPGAGGSPGPPTCCHARPELRLRRRRTAGGGWTLRPNPRTRLGLAL